MEYTKAKSVAKTDIEYTLENVLPCCCMVMYCLIYFTYKITSDIVHLNNVGIICSHLQ